MSVSANEDDFQSEMLALSSTLVREFSDVMSYTWKAPAFLKQQHEIETEKLETYYPYDGTQEGRQRADRAREARWAAVSTALSESFPHLLNVGNLAAVISFYETGLLRICFLLDKHIGISLDEVRGQGTPKFYGYLEKCLSMSGVDMETFEHLEPVRNAFRIRNAFMHASGVLLYSPRRNEMKRIVDNALYLLPRIRSQEMSSEGERLVSIELGDKGEQLRISPKFVWNVSTYCSALLTTICDSFLPPDRQTFRDWPG